MGSSARERLASLFQGNDGRAKGARRGGRGAETERGKFCLLGPSREKFLLSKESRELVTDPLRGTMERSRFAENRSSHRHSLRQWG